MNVIEIFASSELSVFYLEINVMNIVSQRFSLVFILFELLYVFYPVALHCFCSIRYYPDILCPLLIYLALLNLPSCSPEWKRFRSSCYQISSFESTWEDAKQNCERHGAHLVIISDDAEKVFR